MPSVAFVALLCVLGEHLTRDASAAADRFVSTQRLQSWLDNAKPSKSSAVRVAAPTCFNVALLRHRHEQCHRYWHSGPNGGGAMCVLRIRFR